jgi:7-carboxy-7-deazaguanine synthase
MKLAKLNGNSEIFHSIQGEGKNLGRPSVFVRTSLCNLHCVWCDTDYTWNWVGTPFSHEKDAEVGYQKFQKKDWISEISTDEIVRNVLIFNCLNVVLTGGEPMMQQPALVELMEKLRAANPKFNFEIETNGTLVASENLDFLVNQYNVSPKLSNSGNPERLRDKTRAMFFFSKNEKTNFKFVIAAPNDLDEVFLLIKKYKIAPEKIFLMPEGTSREKLATRRAWLVEICKTHQFNYTDRLHIEIYGSKKGV